MRTPLFVVGLGLALASMVAACSGGNGGSAPRGVAQLAPGLLHTCARMDDGAVKCWGGSGNGELGQGDLLARGDQPGEMGGDLPDVELGEPATWIDAGEGHTCALLASGRIKCWGYNHRGQLGLGDMDDRGDQPGEMDAALPYVDLGSAGGAPLTATQLTVGALHACALLEDGTLKCWGDNNAGQLGLENTDRRGDDPGEMGDALPPVLLGTTAGSIAQVVAGGSHTCAKFDSGAVKCWGFHGFGQTGVGQSITNPGATAGSMGGNLPFVDLVEPVESLALGYDHTCALLDSGAVRCFGRTDYGQLGLDDATNPRGNDDGEMGANLPTVNLGGTAVAIAAGQYHTCARLDDATVKCFGYNPAGQLGLGDTQNRGGQAGDMAALPAVDLGGAPDEIVPGFNFTCARFGDRAKCWGDNSAGQLGYGDMELRGDEPGEMGSALSFVEPD